MKSSAGLLLKQRVIPSWLMSSLAEIEAALSAIQVVGDRYNAANQARVNR